MPEEPQYGDVEDGNGGSDVDNIEEVSDVDNIGEVSDVDNIREGPDQNGESSHEEENDDYFDDFEDEENYIDEVQDEDSDYHSLLHKLSKDWMDAELDHTISQAASNSLWRLAFSYIPKILNAKKEQKIN